MFARPAPDAKTAAKRISQSTRLKPPWLSGLKTFRSERISQSTRLSYVSDNYSNWF
eukprot:gene39047-48222_t